MPPADIKATVTLDKGRVRNVVTHPNPEIGGTRVELPARTREAKRRSSCARSLLRGDDALSEVWLDRWTP